MATIVFPHPARSYVITLGKSEKWRHWTWNDRFALCWFFASQESKARAVLSHSFPYLWVFRGRGLSKNVMNCFLLMLNSNSSLRKKVSNQNLNKNLKENINSNISLPPARQHLPGRILQISINSFPKNVEFNIRSLFVAIVTWATVQILIYRLFCHVTDYINSVFGFLGWCTATFLRSKIGRLSHLMHSIVDFFFIFMRPQFYIHFESFEFYTEEKGKYSNFMLLQASGRTSRSFIENVNM